MGLFTRPAASVRTAPLPTTAANLTLGASHLATGAWSPLAAHPVVAASCALADTRLKRTPIRFEQNGQQIDPPMWATDDWLDSFIGDGIRSLWLHGNLFGLARISHGGQIAAVDMIDPTRVTVQWASDNMYQWLIDGAHVAASDRLIHVKYAPVPGQPFGLGAVAASAANIAMGVGADRFLVAHMKHGPKIATLLKPDKPLGTKQARDLRDAIEAATASPEVAWRPLVLSGVEITQIAYNMADAQFVELAKWSDVRLALAFNIDPSVLGLERGGSSLTYQNVQQRDQLLWVDSLSGLANKFERFISALLPRGTVRFDDARWMLGGIGNRAAVAEKLALLNRHTGSEIITADEIRDILGLPPMVGEPVPMSDTSTQ